MGLKPMYWEDDRLVMLDQTKIPLVDEWHSYDDYRQVVRAIREMVVRGAPAIGIAAAYGMALAAKQNVDFDVARSEFAGSRPTAVNLFWVLERLERLPERTFKNTLAEARKIEAEDLQMNLAIGANGAELIPMNGQIMTICNTGALATAGHGTALGVIRSAHNLGKKIHVYSCETRPRQQGLRLTAYELIKEGIPFHSIADSMAGSLMAQGKIDCVIAGADRITINGDTANKIGTYSLAVLAKYHNIPFYVAAPSSTFDPSLPDGTYIPIEERSGTELTHIEGTQIAPSGCPVYNPGFDVTPAELITAHITENGVHTPPYRFTVDAEARW